MPLTAELLALAMSAIGRDRRVVAAIDADLFMHKVLAEPGPAYALLEGGYVLAAAGLIQHWPGLHAGWMVLTEFARPRHLALATRRARDTVRRCQAAQPALYRRVEMSIRWDAAYRPSFARGLGFADPLRLEAWGPDGEDYALYARVARQEAR